MLVRCFGFYFFALIETKGFSPVDTLTSLLMFVIFVCFFTQS